MSATRIAQGSLQPHFFFTIPGTDDLTNATFTCTMLDINDVKIIDNSSAGCYITDEATRQAEYRWQDGDTDITGTFVINFTVTPFEVTPFDTDGVPVEIISSGSDELVVIADVENQIRRDLTNQSDYVTQLISSVREQAESITSRVLKPATRISTLDGFPSGRIPIELQNTPLRYIDSIKYVDTDGVEQTLDPSLYRVISGNNFYPEMPSKILPVYGEVWPDSLNDLSVVTITYVCGYGTILNKESVYETIDLPNAIKQWMLINIANLYNNPETMVIGKTSRLAKVEFPTLADGLIANYIIASW